MHTASGAHIASHKEYTGDNFSGGKAARALSRSLASFAERTVELLPPLLDTSSLRGAQLRIETTLQIYPHYIVLTLTSSIYAFMVRWINLHIAITSAGSLAAWYNKLPQHFTSRARIFFPLLNVIRMMRRGRHLTPFPTNSTPK